MNCGLGSKDNRNKVRSNLNIVRKKIGKGSRRIFLLHQIHSNKLVFIDEKFKHPKKRIAADATITNLRKFPIAVLTADCVPILLYDDKNCMIAAIHAGWKGAYKNIIKKVIMFMLRKGCQRKNITAAIGPCINQKNYNVKNNFKKKFIRKDRNNYIFFKNKKGLIYFDLANFVKSQLKLNKVRKIDMINIDTFNEKNNFFSARRSIKLKDDDYGRNISIIMLN